jgi:hypothetical protein
VQTRIKSVGNRCIAVSTSYSLPAFVAHSVQGHNLGWGANAQFSSADLVSALDEASKRPGADDLGADPDIAAIRWTSTVQLIGSMVAWARSGCW